MAHVRPEEQEAQDEWEAADVVEAQKQLSPPSGKDASLLRSIRSGRVLIMGSEAAIPPGRKRITRQSGSRRTERRSQAASSMGHARPRRSGSASEGMRRRACGHHAPHRTRGNNYRRQPGQRVSRLAGRDGVSNAAGLVDSRRWFPLRLLHQGLNGLQSPRRRSRVRFSEGSLSRLTAVIQMARALRTSERFMDDVIPARPTKSRHAGR